MLVSAKEMLDKAVEGHYAVGQFNINNLEWTKSILLTAEELKSPVILGVSEGAGKYMTGFKTVAAMVKAMMEELNITVPVALHLDHGTYEGCKKCIDAGFSSIMFDGSKYPIEENVEKTRELIAICREKGMSIEAEVGSIGGEEDGVIGRGECADPNECKMIADLGVDMLAAGIGNIHGKYPANWQGLKTTLLESCYLIHRSHIVVSADTGFMHAADLFRIPTLALIGPTAFGFPTGPTAEIFETALSCRPCTKDGSGKCKKSVYQQCMVDIRPETIATRIRQLLPIK